jgi:magnesium-transporting ATPase (P-type)
VNQTETKRTAVLQQIDFVSKVLAIFIGITALITWLTAYFTIDISIVDALSIALVCAVAMIPEGLESIVTMTYVSTDDCVSYVSSIAPHTLT